MGGGGGDDIDNIDTSVFLVPMAVLLFFFSCLLAIVIDDEDDMQSAPWLALYCTLHKTAAVQLHICVFVCLIFYCSLACNNSN